jgi:ABC-type sugar transport system ATPase subunit
LVLGLSVSCNVSLASLPRISPGGVLKLGLEQANARRHVEALHIRAASLDQLVGTLSGGNQQKVVLAKWIETQPRVLLLDEPTRGVDVGTKQEIYSLMRQWTSEGLAILLISTDLPELLGLSDRIVVMHRGETTGVFDRADATPEKIISAAMGSTDPRKERPTPTDADVTADGLRICEVFT